MSKQEAEFPNLSMKRVKITDLDPGIRDVVQALWDAGYETTDSGDGVSKPMFDGVLPFEHVAIRVDFPVPRWDRRIDPEGALRVIESVRGREQSWQVEDTKIYRLGRDAARVVLASRLPDLGAEGKAETLLTSPREWADNQHMRTGQAVWNAIAERVEMSRSIEGLHRIGEAQIASCYYRDEDIAQTLQNLRDAGHDEIADEVSEIVEIRATMQGEIEK